jgi:ubiquinone/menaquinone biosynthesis C-methylase UbiE
MFENIDFHHYYMLYLIYLINHYYRRTKDEDSDMAANNTVHVNECGLPLNAIEWLEKHHFSKTPEREQMIRDLNLTPGSLVVDAGCGPGLWMPLIAQAIGPLGHIIGVDISVESLITAQRRSAGTWYHSQIDYKLASLEQLPIPRGSADNIISANVSQYLPDPVGTFHSMGHYLRPGGRLIVKDIDFGTMKFQNVDEDLQSRVFDARICWEQQRVNEGYAFEDSWVGSKLAGYLEEAGFVDIEEKTYHIVRQYPLPADFRFYLQGICEWFVCEDAPLLSIADQEKWLATFLDEYQSVFEKPDFVSEETEYIVSGTWKHSTSQISYIDMQAR